MPSIVIGNGKSFIINLYLVCGEWQILLDIGNEAIFPIVSIFKRPYFA